MKADICIRVWEVLSHCFAGLPRRVVSLNLQGEKDEGDVDGDVGAAFFRASIKGIASEKAV
jgi:hypothetical protein